MKHLLAWILTAVWALWLLWTGWNYLNLFLSNPGPGSMKELHAAVGAAVVGLAPLYAAWQWHRFSQKRLHKTLTKQREKIDRKLERLGDAQGSPAPGPTPPAGGPMSSEAP